MIVAMVREGTIGKSSVVSFRLKKESSRCLFVNKTFYRDTWFKVTLFSFFFSNLHTHIRVYVVELIVRKSVSDRVSIFVRTMVPFVFIKRFKVGNRFVLNK